VNAKTSRPHRDPSVTREELESLVARYRHLLEEHRRAGVRSRSRRRFEHELDSLSNRFERLLAHTPADEEILAGWRAHLHHAAPAPPEPAPSAPLVFRGRSEAGAELLIRQPGPRELEVLVDGALVERLAHADELFSSQAPVAFHVGGQAYAETFAASPEALRELRAALESGHAAPPERELVLDGLVDRDLGLTPRGRRALALVAAGPAETAASASPIDVVTRGRVSRRAAGRLRTELERLVRLSPRPVLHARGTLTHDENPRLARPVVAKATLDLGSRTVRAQASAGGTAEAIDRLVERLRRALRELRDRDELDRRPAGVAEPGHWRHGNLPPAPPT
jgi:ribosome-associated translation inhibitor RaiA